MTDQTTNPIHTAVLETPTWNTMENRLKSYVLNYNKKIVRVRHDQFQF